MPSGSVRAWAAGLRFVSRSDDGGQTWEPVFGVGFAAALGVDFVDRDTGWVVGEERIFRSTNGGLSWEDQTPNVTASFNVLFAVSFLDTRNGVVVGRDADGSFVVLVTSDGGDGWTPATITGLPAEDQFALSLQAVCLTPDGVGLAVGPANGPNPSIVLLSDRVRTTWTNIVDRIPVGSTRPSYWAAACPDASTLWIAGEDSRVEFSSDAGQTWVDRSISTRTGLVLVDAFFVDAVTGWVPAYDAATDEVLLYSTTDAGVHWREQTLATNVTILEQPPRLAIVFVDRDHGIFVGNDPPSFDPRDQSRVLSFVTSDGGESWRPGVAPPGEDAFYAVDAVP